VILSILARFALALQFTVVATWLSWASVAWVVSIARTGAAGKRSWWAATLGIVGVCLAGLVRPEAAFLGTLLAVPLVLWVFVHAGGRSAALPVVSAAVGMLIVLGSALANEAYYASSPGWEEFYPLNTAKAYFIDNDLVRPSLATTRALRRVDWGDADLDMLRDWFFLDEDIFSLEKMNVVIDTAASRDVPERLMSGLDGLGRMRRDALAEVAIALFVILVLVAPTRVWLWMGGVGAWYVLLALAVAVVFRPMPARVYAPCLAVVVCSGALLASASHLGTVPRRARIVTVLLLLGPALVGIRAAIDESALHELQVAAFREDWLEFSSRPARLVVAWRAAFPYELALSPLRENIGGLGAVPLIGLGTLTRTPFTSLRLTEAGISDLHVALLEDPGVALIASESSLPTLRAFLKDRYGREAQAQRTFSGKTFPAWRLVERSKE
jgi:hypothetical protein